MTRVLNYNVSVPAVVTDAVAIVVPQTPSKVILAELGIFVLPEAANHNRVELKATVGFKGVTGTGSVLYRVFRDAQEIYYAREGFEAAFRAILCDNASGHRYQCSPWCSWILPVY